MAGGCPLLSNSRARAPHPFIRCAACPDSRNTTFSSPSAHPPMCQCDSGAGAELTSLSAKLPSSVEPVNTLSPSWRCLTEPASLADRVARAENTRGNPLCCCRSYCTVPVLRVATVLVSPTFCLSVLASPSLFVASSSHRHEPLAATAHMLASRDDQLSLIIVIPDGVNHRSIPQETADALALRCRLLGLRQCVPDAPNKLASSRHLSQIDITQACTIC